MFDGVRNKPMNQRHKIWENPSTKKGMGRKSHSPGRKKIWFRKSTTFAIATNTCGTVPQTKQKQIKVKRGSKFS